MDYDGIYLPLQGEHGVRPKAPAVGAWQSPGYKGFTQALAYHDHLDTGQWFGLRCDNLVVVDCDTVEATDLWELHVGTPNANTWVRKTPRGYHYIYAARAASPTAPAAGVWPHIDIRAGRTSQVVYYAPGYTDLSESLDIRNFDPSWLPESFGATQQDRSNVESWDEMPDGRGNNTMASFAGAFRKQGMSPRTIARCLGAINRITMTADPMPIEMLVEITKSVSRYKPMPDIDIEVVDEDD